MITKETITKSLCTCADWIKEHAAELVGQIENVTSLTVTIQFDPACIPTVTAYKEYLQPKAVVIDDADYFRKEL
jgi:metal-sulfur cluster biosynthetic enzyme